MSDYQTIIADLLTKIGSQRPVPSTTYWEQIRKDAERIHRELTKRLEAPVRFYARMRWIELVCPGCQSQAFSLASRKMGSRWRRERESWNPHTGQFYCSHCQWTWQLAVFAWRIRAGGRQGPPGDQVPNAKERGLLQELPYGYATHATIGRRPLQTNIVRLDDGCTCVPTAIGFDKRCKVHGAPEEEPKS